MNYDPYINKFRILMAESEELGSIYKIQKYTQIIEERTIDRISWGDLDYFLNNAFFILAKNLIKYLEEVKENMTSSMDYKYISYEWRDLDSTGSDLGERCSELGECCKHLAKTFNCREHAVDFIKEKFGEIGYNNIIEEEIEWKVV